MRIASEIILALSIEQESTGPSWPHPWDHYPFATGSGYVWLRYRDLNAEQRAQVREVLGRVRRRLGALSVRSGLV
jgi:hypothetical protein